MLIDEHTKENVKKHLIVLGKDEKDIDEFLAWYEKAQESDIRRIHLVSDIGAVIFTLIKVVAMAGGILYFFHFLFS